MTAADVLRRALELAERQVFDCPYCAIARAKTELDGDSQPRELLETMEILRQYLRQEVTPLSSDQPLVDATEAMRRFSGEIASCPSAVSQERTKEMLSMALEAV